jgi:hypothetical protein
MAGTYKNCALCGKEWCEYNDLTQEYCGGHRTLEQRVNWTKNQRESRACPTPTKRKYLTENDALGGLTRKIARETYAKTLRVYACPCGAHHITSQPLREKH